MMSTTVSVVTSPCTSTVTSTDTSPTKNRSATAKLLIQRDGRIQLKANSQHFPTPGVKDSHKLYASYTKSGTMNVYYSPTGNTSEVYLLRPKDTAGLDKNNSPGDSVISKLFLKQNANSGDITNMPTITVVNDRKGLNCVTENKISLLKQPKFNKDEVVTSSNGSSKNIGHLKSVVPSAVNRPKNASLPKTKVTTFPDNSSRSPSPDPEECLAALPNMDIGKTIAAFLKDTENKNTNLPVSMKQHQKPVNVRLPVANRFLEPKGLKASRNVPLRTVSVQPSSNNSTVSASQKLQYLVTTMRNEYSSTGDPTIIKSTTVPERSSIKENCNSRGSQNDSSSMSIRIDSVFSLADTSNECVDKETTPKEDPINKAKLVKELPKLGPKSFKVSQQMKASRCKPCFVVLERTWTPRLIRKNKRKERMLQVKCSDHCRRRTLVNLCRLGLLDCKHSKQKDVRKSIGKVVPAKKVEENGVKIRPNIINASELFPTNEQLTNDHKNQNRLVFSKFDNKATKATLVRPNVASSRSKNTSTVTGVPLISKPTSQITSHLSNKASVPCNVTLSQSLMQSSSSRAINSQVVISNSNSLKQQITGGNNKYILVNVAGKNVLIPAVVQGKSNDNAFVINPNKDGTSMLLPAKITYNKITSGQSTSTTATTTMSKPSTVADNVTLTSCVAPQTSISSEVHSSGLVVMSNNTVPVTNITVPFSNTKPVTSDPINKPAQGVRKSTLIAALQRISTCETSTTATATTTVSSSSTNDSSVNAVAKKRKKTLAERYPLPPGVFIKKEPVTTGYGDEEPDTPPTKKVTNTQAASTLTSRDVTHAICNMLSHKKKTPNVSNSRDPLNVNLTNNGKFITMRLPNSSTQEIRLLPTQNLIPSPSHKAATPNTSKNQPVIRIVNSTNTSTPSVSSVSSTSASVVIRTVPPPNLNQRSSPPTVPIAEPTVTFAAPGQLYAEPQPFLDIMDEVEDVMDPPSPGPPDLGEPQVILSSKDISNSVHDADSSMIRTEPADVLPVTKSTQKTEKEKRIERLKQMLREREEALEEMRRKKAVEEPIDFDDDF